MSNEETLKCLDSLALALTEHEHQRTPEQRSRYERCAAFLRPEMAGNIPRYAESPYVADGMRFV